LATLQLVRLKKRPRLPDVAGAGLTPGEPEVVVQELRRAGKLEESRGRYRLTARGPEALAHSIAQERLRIDFVEAPGDDIHRASDASVGVPRTPDSSTTV
ncbi:MAG TPA: hypothetical protein VJ777_23065, partial [Mycobacterium sp.]|nr:hypothetical protein [Mycobacterium sp.]